jgi:hypothetical protein
MIGARLELDWGLIGLSGRGSGKRKEEKGEK